jgi:Ser/Thr protein kinase RdoA (MazF antagonist)
MENRYFPVIKSFLAEEALAREIEAAYGLSSVRCQLIAAFMRDVYLVTANKQRYILFIYRRNQRTIDEIMSEWRFVAYLKANGVSVAPAIATKSGEFILTFPAPEGIRYGVLTTFAAGKHLRQRSSVEAVSRYGRLIGQIHTLADEAPFALTRPVNEVALIVNQAIAAFAVAVPERPQDLAYLRECAGLLLPKFNGLPQRAPYYGLIHGDVIRANAQVADDGTVTVLDFDLCGPGWRAYDIASYLAVIRGLPDEVELADAFINGYEQVRPITSVERETLPAFEAVRVIFSIGVPALNVSHWGSAYLHTFLDQSLEQLREQMKRIGQLQKSG